VTYLFEVRQPEEITDVLDHEPVLIQIGMGEAGAADHRQGWLPQPVVGRDPNPGAGAGEPADFLQHLLHVPDVVQQIGQDDDVESSGKRQGMRITLDESKSGVPLRCRPNHFFREVDADPQTGPEGGQEVAFPAADLQDTKPGPGEAPKHGL
jgi:hypothetical protein